MNPKDLQKQDDNQINQYTVLFNEPIPQNPQNQAALMNSIQNAPVHPEATSQLYSRFLQDQNQIRKNQNSGLNHQQQSYFQNQQFLRFNQFPHVTESLQFNKQNTTSQNYFNEYYPQMDLTNNQINNNTMSQFNNQILEPQLNGQAVYSNNFFNNQSPNIPQTNLSNINNPSFVTSEPQYQEQQGSGNEQNQVSSSKQESVQQPQSGQQPLVPQQQQQPVQQQQQQQYQQQYVQQQQQQANANLLLQPLQMQYQNANYMGMYNPQEEMIQRQCYLGNDQILEQQQTQATVMDYVEENQEEQQCQPLQAQQTPLPLQNQPFQQQQPNQPQAPVPAPSPPPAPQALTPQQQPQQALQFQPQQQFQPQMQQQQFGALPQFAQQQQVTYQDIHQLQEVKPQILSTPDERTLLTNGITNPGLAPNGVVVKDISSVNGNGKQESQIKLNNPVQRHNKSINNTNQSSSVNLSAHNLASLSKKQKGNNPKRNTLKNLGNQIIAYLCGKKDKESQDIIFKMSGVEEGAEQLQFKEYCQKHKNKILKIQDLRALWLEMPRDLQKNKFHKAIRIASRYYLRKETVNKILTSQKLKGKLTHLEIRRTLLEKIKSPEHFSTLE